MDAKQAEIKSDTNFILFCCIDNYNGGKVNETLFLLLVNVVVFIFHQVTR
jgi:hypothetical protein